MMADQKMAYQPFRPPAPDFAADPGQLERLQRMGESRQELEAMSAALKRAEEDRKFNMPKGASIGNQFRAASPLAFLGNFLSSVSGDRDAKTLNDQAAALRGELGEEEKLKYEMAQRQAQQQAIAGQDIQEAKDKNRALELQFKAEQDALDRKQRKLERIKASGTKPSATQMATYTESGRLIGVIDEINATYAGMDEASQKGVDTPVKDAAISIFPSALGTLVKGATSTSPVKEYQTRVSRLESKLSQLASGLSVTGYEMDDRNKWSPNAPGINQAERQQRLDNVRRDLVGEIGAHHQVYGRDEIETPYTYDQPPEAAAPAAPRVPIGELTDDQLNAMSDEELASYLEADNGDS